jgi:hypothetical protein
MISVGDKVYYRENGVWDIGTVLDIDDDWYEVQWHSDNYTDHYTPDQIVKVAYAKVSYK